MIKSKWVFKLDDPEAMVILGSGEDQRDYRDGDTLDLPSGWEYDKGFSDHIGRPSFKHYTLRKTRDPKTGRWSEVKDWKHTTLPVVEVTDEYQDA